MATSANSPWNWVVETLADFKKVNPSILMDLVERAPGISDDMGKNAREMVSLRILESLFMPKNRSTVDADWAQDTKIGFDSSESCESVLRRILHEAPESNQMNGSEKSKWDVQPFIMHKRSCLPKFALQQLKEAILERRHPLLASLEERSGLVVADISENRNSVVGAAEKYDQISLNPEIRDDKVQEDLLNKNLCHGNQISNESATETPKEASHPVQIILVSGDRRSTESNPANTLKPDSVCTEPAVILNSVSSHEKRTEDSSEGFVQHRRSDECNLSKEPWIEGLEERRSADGSDYENTPSKKLGHHCRDSNKSNPAKKLKLDSVCTQQTVNLNSVSSQVTERIDDSSGGMEQQTRTEECDFSKEPWTEGLKESRFPGGGHDENADASKKLKQSCDYHSNESNHAKKQTINQISCLPQETEKIQASGVFVLHTQREKYNISKDPCADDLDESMMSDDEHVASGKLIQGCNADDAMLYDQEQIPCIEDKVPQEISAYELGRKASVFKDGSGEIKELYVTGNSENNDDDFQPKTMNGESVVKAKDNSEHGREPGVCSEQGQYDNERTVIFNKKHAFLSSHYAHIEDSLETFDFSDRNLCVKCNKGGHMLVCCSDACLLVVHESCLGSAASFDGNGNFYCPFCAYSRAISHYQEAKRKALLARKDLQAFIGFGSKHRRKKSPEGFSCSVQNQPREEGSAGTSEVKITGCRSTEEHMVLAEPSVPCVNDDPRCGGKSTAIFNEANCDLTGDALSGKTMPKEYEPPRELEEQQTSGPIFVGCEANSCRVTIETGCVLMENGVQDPRVVQNCQSSKGMEEQQIAGPGHDGPNTSSFIRKETGHVANGTNCCLMGDKLEGQKEGKKICHGSERHPEGQIQPTLLNRQLTAISHEPSTNIQGSLEVYEPIASNYSIRDRKQKPQYTYPATPLPRRKKITWTNLEEETLKEGLLRFSNVNDSVVPWKKILDFGGTVFQGRTTIDLKDKWRNICKGSPKSK